LAGESLGELTARVALPEEWRFVLIRGCEAQGLAGERESDAFASLPAVPNAVTAELRRIANEDMLPAVVAGDCDAFGEAVFRFGQLAGECFSVAQGGTFASPIAARLIAAMRDRGVRGVGQSSWGPTVFAITPDAAAAESLVEWLNRDAAPDAIITVSSPNNCGAQITLS
jgi:beta-RFAP synthase